MPMNTGGQRPGLLTGLLRHPMYAAPMVPAEPVAVEFPDMHQPRATVLDDVSSPALGRPSGLEYVPDALGSGGTYRSASPPKREGAYVGSFRGRG